MNTVFHFDNSKITLTDGVITSEFYLYSWPEFINYKWKIIDYDFIYILI
jgi:hypothetical protein